MTDVRVTAVRGTASSALAEVPARWRQRLLAPLLCFVALLTMAAAARAQAVHWENGDASLGNVIQLVFEDCEPDGDPQLPALNGAKLAFAGRSESVNMVNFNVSRTITLSYLVQGHSGGGALQIPAFTVKTSKGPIRVAAFNAAAPAISADSVASARLIPERTTVWAGEVFGLSYELTAARRNNPQINPTFDWNPAPLVAEDWSKPAINENTGNGQRQLVVSYRTRAYAKTPNSVTLSAATQLLQIQVGSASFGLFTQPRMEPVSVTSDQPVIEVKPLPTPPAGFTGAVGQFKLTSKVVPQQAAIGEPVTWTLELAGTGNWPDIAGLPQREVSKDFQVIQPKAKRTPAEGKLFDVTLTEDVVLVPTKTGTYTLGPVSFTYFDPQAGAYRTLTTDRTSLTITPPAAAPFGATSPSATTSSGSGAPAAGLASTGPAKPVATPALPGGIPRDPLPGIDDVARPLSDRAMVLGLLAPLGGLLLLWLALAWRRARRNDPQLAQREARARLALLLADLRTNPPSAKDRAGTASRLLQWERDTAVLWRLDHAAPGAVALEAAIAHTGAPQEVRVAWGGLWRDADRALYGPSATLPDDWIARAEAALDAKRVPGFQPARLFLPRNLLPFAAAIVLALLATGPRVHAAEESPEAAYRSGDFAAAEKAWHEAVAAHPTDWIARHNLSLALSQQDRTGEALGEAAAALVQHPNDASVRWHFGLAMEKAGFGPPPLAALVKDGPAADLATLAGPAQWQRILIVAAFALAGALGWALVNAYGRRTRVQFWGAAVVAAIAVIVGASAIFGLESYGDAIDTRAVVAWRGGTLRSIPTEADTTQKTTPLAAGSLAVVDRTFLGWDRLAFTNGQTGWVRHEEVIPLWR